MKRGRPSKTVIQYDMKMNVVATYPSAAEAARSAGFGFDANSIRNVCSGRSQSAYGYVWKYAEDEMVDHGQEDSVPALQS